MPTYRFLVYPICRDIPLPSPHCKNWSISTTNYFFEARAHSCQAPFQSAHAPTFFATITNHFWPLIWKITAKNSKFAILRLIKYSKSRHSTLLLAGCLHYIGGLKYRQHSLEFIYSKFNCILFMLQTQFKLFLLKIYNLYK